MTRFTSTALLAIFALSSTAAAASVNSAFHAQAPLFVGAGAEVIEGEYIVQFKEEYVSTTADVDALIDSILSGVSSDSAAELIHRYDVGFAAKMSDDLLNIVRDRSEVQFVEQNQRVSVRGVQENPPSWGLARIFQLSFRTQNRYEYPDSAGEGVDAYIIDTGVNIKHEDFEGRAKWGFTAPRGEKDTDGNGHGTHVGSTVGGAKYGVAKKVSVIAVKVLDSRGSGTMADVIKGVEWAATSAKNSGRKSLANMSLGGGRSSALDIAVQRAIASGLHFAIAAGNSNTDACRSSPAAVEEAVTVGATDKYDQRAYFSNYGKCVDIFAPGLDITGAWKDSTTASKTISGTSMASPHVAGVMALFLAQKDYSPKELKDELERVSFKDILSGIPSDTVNRLLNNNVGSDSEEIAAEPAAPLTGQDLYF